MGSIEMTMPPTLKIVIGLIVIAITSQIFSMAKYDSLDNPSSYAMNIFWIIAWIAIIRGFLSRSNILRRLAIAVSLIGLLGLFFALYFYTVVPFAKPKEHTAAIIFAIIGILIQGFTIVVLTSHK
ncbi:MAG: hypothetical protein WAU91_02315, partial [Desulfatitalea sp.]